MSLPALTTILCPLLKLSLPDFGKAGGKFEDALTRAMCKALGGNYPEFLWLEPKVSLDGTPLSDGFGCKEALNDLEGARTRARSGQKGKRPDFIIKGDGGPYSTDYALTGGRGNKSWLVGDLKITMNAAYSDVKKKDEQWQTMMNYAKRQNNHEYAPVALYITYFDGTQGKEKSIERRSLKEEVIVRTISILPVKLK